MQKKESDLKKKVFQPMCWTKTEEMEDCLEKSKCHTLTQNQVDNSEKILQPVGSLRDVIFECPLFYQMMVTNWIKNLV